MSEKFIEYLNSCNKKDVNKFCFKDCVKTVKVVDVYDGDTVTVLLNIDPKEEDLNLVFKFKVRMYGYNSEEIKLPKNCENRDERKKKALEQRDWLREKVMNKIVYLECLGSDKYGRILGKIYLNKDDEKCLNDIIVESGLCVEYIL